MAPSELPLPIDNQSAGERGGVIPALEAEAVVDEPNFGGHARDVPLPPVGIRPCRQQSHHEFHPTCLYLGHCLLDPAGEVGAMRSEWRIEKHLAEPGNGESVSTFGEKTIGTEVDEALTVRVGGSGV
jgi:hypothetical protein